jgi:hypothetical protein
MKRAQTQEGPEPYYTSTTSCHDLGRDPTVCDLVETGGNGEVQRTLA